MVGKPGQRDAFCKPASGTGGGHAVCVHGGMPPVPARPLSLVLLWATPWPVAQGSNPCLSYLPHWQTGSLRLVPPGKPPRGTRLSQRKNEVMLSAATRMGLETLRQGQTISLTCGV